MSVQALTWVIANSQAKGGTLLTLIMIANYAGADGTGAWPSIARLAKDTRLTDRAVQLHLRELEKMGEVIVEKGQGPHGCNCYTLPIIRGEKITPLTGEKISGGEAHFTPGGENITPLGVKPTSPNPSIKPSIKPSYSNATEKQKKKKPMIDCPEGFSLTDEMYEKAKGKGFKGDRQHMELVFETFLNHHASKGTRFADWGRAWETWVGNSISYGQDMPKMTGGGNGTQGRLGGSEQGGPRQLEVQKSAKPGKSFGRHLADVG